MGKDRKWKPVKPTKQAVVHTVTYKGETMALISKWYTGKTENAADLIKANPTVNPQRIVAGTVIYIPKKLLKTRRPMPKKFIDASKKKKVTHTKKKGKKRPPVKKEQPTEEFELFGPR